MAVLLGAVADLSVFLIARAKAQTAADAASLAAAGAMVPGVAKDPRSEAGAFASLNGADIIDCDCPVIGRSAQVKVAVPVRFILLKTSPGYVTASARSEVQMPR